MSGIRGARPFASPRTAAESLLTIGRCASRQTRCGAGIEEAAGRLGVTTEYCMLALAVFRSSELTKFRAMVEGWSLERIIAELGGPKCIWPREAQGAAAR